jgi:serine/threonine-protein kinase HipA
LKFPVPEAGEYASDILYHEGLYQRVAQRLGLRVTAELPEFVDGALLIPRFDRQFARGAEIRLGVESLYSITGVLDSASSAVRHHDVLIALENCVTDFELELREYIRRDLLNLALGNRDNHGRNMAVLKHIDGRVELAPLYDFGPSFLDARAITRVIRWDGEGAGHRDWNHIVSNLSIRFEEAGIPFASGTQLLVWMRGLAEEVETLPAIMSECGVAQHVIDRRRADIDRLMAELQAIQED